ncbi:MAG: terminase small subunit, partial [Clostridia bacterium]|nr:terminase small subunit [Clostridia bacterium]
MQLTDKQKRFCQEYIIDFNATQAAIRAGYSEKTAYSIGDENLRKPEIKNYIEELKTELKKQTDIKLDNIIEEACKIGFADIDMSKVRPADKIKALETIAHLLGLDEQKKDDAPEWFEETMRYL